MLTTFITFLISSRMFFISRVLYFLYVVSFLSFFFCILFLFYGHYVFSYFSENIGDSSLPFFKKNSASCMAPFPPGFFFSSCLFICLSIYLIVYSQVHWCCQALERCLPRAVHGERSTLARSSVLTAQRGLKPRWGLWSCYSTKHFWAELVSGAFASSELKCCIGEYKSGAQPTSWTGFKSCSGLKSWWVSLDKWLHYSEFHGPGLEQAIPMHASSGAF